MKPTPKYYEYGSVSCDMRNTRNTFFKIMCDGKHVADIACGIYTVRLNITILQGLSGELYNDIFELISLISKNNELNGFNALSINLLDHERVDSGDGRYKKIKHSTPYPTEFPRFRRKREDGVLFEKYNRSFSFSHEVKKHVAGKFFMILHEDNNILINKETCLKLIASGVNVKFVNHPSFPRILVGGEIIKHSAHSFVYIVDKIDVLENVNINLTRGRIRFEIDRAHFQFYVHEGDLKTGNIKLPKIKISDGLTVNVVIQFINCETGDLIELNETMFDFEDRSFDVKSHYIQCTLE